MTAASTAAAAAAAAAAAPAATKPYDQKQGPACGAQMAAQSEPSSNRPQSQEKATCSPEAKWHSITWQTPATTSATQQKSLKTQGSTLSGDRSVATQASSVADIRAQSSFLLSFDEDEDLFRGVPLCSVLRNCGSIWGTSQGCTNTYSMSHRVEFLRTFISHNWSVGRFRKYVALCLHFNFQMAVVALLIASIILTVLHILGTIPCINDYVVGESDRPVQSGFAVRVAAGPVFLFTLFFGRNLVASCGWLGPDVFLDKVCIHQTNRRIQKKGILKLGAFLRHSEEMLILYTNVYLLKLWTVFEVAAFLLVHPVKQMKVVPVNLAVLFCVAVCCGNLGPVGVAFCRANRVADTYGVAFTHFSAYFYVYFLRRWYRDKALMKERLLNFSVRDSLCAVETDRPVVFDNIVAMLKANGKVKYEASREEALAEFDRLVRTELPGAFASAFGSYLSFTYGQVLVMAFVASASMSVDLLGGLGEADTQQTKEIVAGFCSYLVWGIIFYPTFWALREYIACFKLHWHGWKDIVMVCLSQLLSAALGFPLLNLFDVLREKAEESDVFLAVSVALTIVSCTIGAYAVSWLFTAGTGSGKSESKSLEVEDVPQASAVPIDNIEIQSDEGFPKEDFML